MRKTSVLAGVARLIASALLTSTTLPAQANSASLSGTVTDPTGSRLTSAMVSVENKSTRATRRVHANGAGIFVLPELPAGRYEFRVEAAGFRTDLESSIVLSVGEQRTLNVQLRPGAESATITVQSNPLTVETQSATISAVTGQQAIEQLPLNGRDLTQLAILSPGVVPSRRVVSDSQGNARQISIEGRRPNQVSFLLDGTDANDAYNNTPGSAAGVLLGADAVAEFRVLSNGYGAEYGRTAGGIVSEITRSGSDRFHGSALAFVRNSAADAKNFFDDPAAPIPRFQRNQFGGALGGPLNSGAHTERLFFFGNYEGLRQRLGQTRIAIVPNAQARTTAVASVRPYLAIIPLPNSVVFTDGTGQYLSRATTPANEDFAMGRMDWQRSERISYFVRYQIDASQVVLPDLLLLSDNRNRSRDQYATLLGTQVLRPNLVNAASASYNRSFFSLDFDYLKPIDPSLSFIPGRPFGQISITGLAPVGPQRFGPTLNALNLFEGLDTVTWTHGRHVLTAGVDEQQVLFPQQAPQSQNGFYLFNSVSSFLRGTPTSVEVALPGSVARRHWRQHLDATWVSDTWRVRTDLTLTGGVRYERASVPSEKDGLSAMLRDPLHDTASTVGPLYSNPASGNFMPRLGVAYAPGSAQKTSLRSAFGVFFDPLWTDFYLNAGSRQPPFFNVGGTQTPPSFPNAAISGSNFIPGRIDILQYHPASPYTLQWNASVEQELHDGLRLTVAYSGNRGVHDTRIVDANQALPQIVNGRKFFPVNSAVRNPNFTALRLKQTNGLSSYNALTTTVEYRRGSLLTMRGAHTWSKSLDTGSLVTAQGGEDDVPQDPDSLRAEKGLSNYDLRHYFAGTVVSDWPQFCHQARACNGWQTNMILVLSSGNPFSPLVSYDSARARFGTGPSPERPNLVTGRSANPVRGGAQHYFDASAFALPAPGFYGNLPRNTIIGPGLASLDMALNKTTTLRENFRLQLRAELFNVPNHPNFAIPSQRNVFSPAGAVASAGLITQTLTTSRQLQIGARLEF